MSLTMGGGPLSVDPPERVNYELASPAGSLLMQPFPRRVRAVLAGWTVADTREGMLLHETGLLPQLYFPDNDIRADLLEPSEHVTYCPYKGNARYFSLLVDGRSAENVVWSYPDPSPAASWLAGYSAVQWNAMDAWWDEDEEVSGHLRDPYHRVDVRASGRHVRVLAGDAVLAASDRPLLLSETGFPNRYYLPREDVRPGLLWQSSTVTRCPYKGSATYLATRERDDVAWSYEQPLHEMARIAGHVCFDPARVTVEVDGGVSPG